MFFINKKKNLIFEPLWDLFYYNYNLKKNLIINLNDIIRNYSLDKSIVKNQNKLPKIIEIIYKKNKKYFSKKIIKKLIIQAEEINQKSNYLINYINKIFNKSKFQKIIWCCDPDSYTANVISYFKKKNIQIIGIQHGGGYLLQNYGSHHTHSDFNFCDKFLSYGASEYLMNKKILTTGSLRYSFYKKYCVSKTFLKKNYDIMYVPNPIECDYSHNLNKNSYEKIILQDRIINYLKQNSFKVIVKFPQYPSLSHYPLLLDRKTMKNFSLRYEKIYKSVKNYEPRIIILDYFSTSIYECLFNKSEIILFLDKHNMPKKDIIHALNKRVHIIYNFSELDITINRILKNNLNKNNSEFLNKFFSKKNEKKLMKIFN